MSNDVEINVSASSAGVKRGMSEAVTGVAAGSADIQAAIKRMAEQAKSQAEAFESTWKNASQHFEANAKAVKEAATQMSEQTSASLRSMAGVAAESLGGAQTIMLKFNNTIMALQGAMSGGRLFQEATASVIAYSGEVSRLSKTFGTTVESASGLNVALRLVGLSSEDYVGMAFRLQRQIKSNEDGMRSMGLEVRNSDGSYRSLQDVMVSAASKLKEYKEGQDRNQAAMYLFGRGAQEAMAITKMNSEVMARANDMASKYGLTLNNETTDAAKKYRMEVAAANVVMESLEHKIGEAVLPVMVQLKTTFGEVAGQLVTDFSPAMIASAERFKDFGSVIARYKDEIGTVAQVAIGGLMTNAVRTMALSMSASTVKIYENITAATANSTQAVKTAATTANAALAAQAHAGMLAAEAEAAVASATGMARLSLVQSTLIPARMRLEAATAAATAAELALANAQREAALTTTALNAALGMLGGPLGVIVTLLGAGATAWSVWGNAAKEAGDEASKSVGHFERGLQTLERLKDQQKYGSGDIGAMKAGTAAATARIAELSAQQRKNEGLKNSEDGGGDPLSQAVQATGNDAIDKENERIQREINEKIKFVTEATAKIKTLEKEDASPTSKQLEWKDPKEKSEKPAKEQSQMPIYEAELSKKIETFEKAAQTEGTLRQYSKADEAAYWKEVSTSASVSAEDKARAEKKWRDVERHLRSEAFVVEIATIEQKKQAAQNDFSERISLAEDAHKRTVAMYGAESKEAAVTAGKVEEEKRKLTHQLAQLDNISGQMRRDNALADIEAERQDAEHQLAMGLITKEGLLKQQIQFEEQMHAIKLQALQQALLAVDPQKDPVKKAELDAQIEQLERQHQARMRGLSFQAAQESSANMRGMLSGIESSWSNSIKGMMTGTMSLTQGIKGMFKGVVDAVIGMFAQMIAKWMVQQIMMAAFGKTIAAADVSKEAAKAGAGGVASMAAAPFPLNLTAPEFGASMAAAAMFYAPAVASAAGGFDIPAGMNPMTQLHEKEMVLPSRYAEVIRGMAEGGGGGGGASGPVVNVHIAKAFDGNDVKRVLMANQGALVESLSKAYRNGYRP